MASQTWATAGTYSWTAPDGVFQVDTCSTLGSAAGGGKGFGGTSGTVLTYLARATYTYEGVNADSSPNPGYSPGARINFNGNSYQGDDQLGDNGNTSTFITWPTSIPDDISGGTITDIQITLNNNHCWYNTGMTYHFGKTSAGVGGSTRPAITDPNLVSGSTAEGASHTYSLSGNLQPFINGLGSGQAFVLYNPTSTRFSYGYFAGAGQTGPPKLQIFINFTTEYGGGGGGGGGLGTLAAFPVTPGLQYPVFVGAGGLWGSNDGTGSGSGNGGDGDRSSFQGDSDTCTGNGGHGGTGANSGGAGPGGSAGTGNAGNGTGGAGGNASQGGKGGNSGDGNVDGGPASTGVGNDGTNNGGAGGGGYGSNYGGSGQDGKVTITWTPVTSFAKSSSDSGSGASQAGNAVPVSTTGSDASTGSDGGPAIGGIPRVGVFDSSRKDHPHSFEHCQGSEVATVFANVGGLTPASADSGHAADGGERILNIRPSDGDTGSVDPVSGEFGASNFNPPLSVSDDEVAAFTDGKIIITDDDSSFNAAEGQSVAVTGGPVFKSGADAGSAAQSGSKTVGGSQVAQIIGARYTGQTLGYVSPPVPGSGSPATEPANYNWATGIIGNLQGSKYFYSGTLPSTFPNTANGSTLPAGVTPFICYITQMSSSALKSFCQSVNRPIVLVYRQEPEAQNKYTLGSTFVSEFKGQSDIIRSAGNSNVSIAMCSGGYSYRTGGSSDTLAGNYLRGLGSVSPVSGKPYLDYYCFDSYYNGLPNGYTLNLSTASSFQNWVNLVTNTSVVGVEKPIGITEYGLGVGNGAAARSATIQADHDYIGGVGAFSGAAGLPSQLSFPVFCWLYWWNDNAMTSSTDTLRDYQFTDSATENLWASFMT